MLPKTSVALPKILGQILDVLPKFWKCGSRRSPTRLPDGVLFGPFWSGAGPSGPNPAGFPTFFGWCNPAITLGSIIQNFHPEPNTQSAVAAVIGSGMDAKPCKIQPVAIATSVISTGLLVLIAK